MTKDPEYRLVLWVIGTAICTATITGTACHLLSIKAPETPRESTPGQNWHHVIKWKWDMLDAEWEKCEKEMEGLTMNTPDQKKEGVKHSFRKCELATAQLLELHGRLLVKDTRIVNSNLETYVRECLERKQRCRRYIRHPLFSGADTRAEDSDGALQPAMGSEEICERFRQIDQSQPQTVARAEPTHNLQVERTTTNDAPHDSPLLSQSASESESLATQKIELAREHLAPLRERQSLQQNKQSAEHEAAVAVVSRKESLINHEEKRQEISV